MSILKTLSVGEGDLFYIKHGSSNFTIIDCNMDENNRCRLTTIPASRVMFSGQSET